MNVKDNYAAAIAAGDTARAAEIEAMAWDMAYEQAAEMDGPNSPDFDALQARIYEDILGVA